MRSLEDSNSTNNSTWSEEFVTNTFNRRKGDIVAAVDGLQGLEIKSVTTNNDSQAASSSSSSSSSDATTTTAISLSAAAGVSALAFIIGGLFLHRRNNVATKTRKSNGTYQHGDEYQSSSFSSFSSSTNNNDSNDSNITPTGISFPVRSLGLIGDDLSGTSPYDQGIEVQLMDVSRPVERAFLATNNKVRKNSQTPPQYRGNNRTIPPTARSKPSRNNKATATNKRTERSQFLRTDSWRSEQDEIVPRDKNAKLRNQSNGNNLVKGSKRKSIRKKDHGTKRNVYDAYYNQIVDLLEDVCDDENDDYSDSSSTTDHMYNEVVNKSTQLKKLSNRRLQPGHNNRQEKCYIGDTVDL